MFAYNLERFASEDVLADLRQSIGAHVVDACLTAGGGGSASR